MRDIGGDYASVSGLPLARQLFDDGRTEHALGACEQLLFTQQRLEAARRGWLAATLGEIRRGALEQFTNCRFYHTLASALPSRPARPRWP